VKDEAAGRYSTLGDEFNPADRRIMNSRMGYYRRQ
jgi:hypothetical protein